MVEELNLFIDYKRKELKVSKPNLEIKRRVAIGKATMIGLEKLWRDKHVSIDTKKYSENTNFHDSSVWLRDVDNDKENGKEDQRMRDVDTEVRLGFPI